VIDWDHKGGGGNMGKKGPPQKRKLGAKLSRYMKNND